MAFEIQQGPRGLAALWNGKRLSSAYDAAREAQTWTDSLAPVVGALTFVLGDPWGLATQALTARGVRAVALLPGPEALPHVATDLRCWAPGSVSLETFLEAILEQEGPEAVTWEVWPAFERLAPEVSLEFTRRFRDLYRTVQGSWLTYRRFGRRYWSNCLRNALDWEQPSRLVAGNKPIVIAASGPSLDAGLATLARHRDRFDLWALPSSFETLVRRGMVPDAGVATDAGFYAREHLHRLVGTEVPVLASLSSAPDPSLRDRSVLFFGQGLEVERRLLTELLPQSPEVPSQGTVAVTALRLALEATSGPVLIAGLDLSFADLRGHTSPHTVDRRLEAQHQRLTPLETLWSQRLVEQATVFSDGVRTSPALLTYAGWFRTRARFARPVYRIAPSALRWTSMPELTWPEAESLLESAEGRRPIHFSRVAAWPSREQRRKCILMVTEALRRRVEDPSTPAAWLKELARTAAAEALAEDYRSLRRGDEPARVPAALAAFLGELEEGLR